MFLLIGSTVRCLRQHIFILTLQAAFKIPGKHYSNRFSAHEACVLRARKWQFSIIFGNWLSRTVKKLVWPIWTPLASSRAREKLVAELFKTFLTYTQDDWSSCGGRLL